MRCSWIALVTLSFASTACFDPESGRLDSTAGTSSPTPIDPSTTTAAEDLTTAATSATSVVDGTAGGTTQGDTTLALDGTSTGPGSESDATSVTTNLVSSSSGAGESEGSSSTGAMACMLGPEEVEFESIGDFISQGDAWQSFTANSDGEIVRIDFYWNLSGTNDAFTINLYEGEGTGGAQLHSQGFPGQGMGTFVGFDTANVLATPIPITAGSVYTVQGVDTFGWQTASGAIAGSTSSLGMGQHKNIRVWIEPCL
jgi:hypothetical protein